MDLQLKLHNQNGTTIANLFKDHQSPTSYKEFILEIQRNNRLSRYIVPADTALVQDIFDKLNISTISPFRPGNIGLDGVSYELSFRNGSTASSFSWWMTPPKGWEPLSEVATLVFALAQHYFEEYI